MRRSLLSEQVKELREACLWTQEQLAEECNLSVTTIRRLENGSSYRHRYDTYSSVIAAFRIRLRELDQEELLDNALKQSEADDAEALNIYRLDHLPGNYALYYPATGDPETTIHVAHLTFYEEVSELKASVNAVGFDYHGVVKLDSNCVTLFSRGTEHHEYLMIKLTYPLQLDFDCIAGIFAALTRECLPVGGMAIAHKVSDPVEPHAVPYDKCDQRIANLLVHNGDRPLIVAPRLKSNRLEEL